jgi:alpha-L-arabinofuranosidase
MDEIKSLSGTKTTKITNGQIISRKETGTFNTFEHPDQVTLQKFEDASFKNKTLK